MKFARTNVQSPVAFISLLINALLYPHRVDGIKQTYKHGYIYTYTNMNIQINHTLKTNIIIMQLY